MASALETRIRKLESQAAVVAEAAEKAKAKANEPPFDWEEYVRLFRKMDEEHPRWWADEQWYVQQLGHAETVSAQREGENADDQETRSED